jgi:chemotaxis protein methyltransferase CheR
LALTEDKIYLLESRLSNVQRKWMFGNLEEMTKDMRLTPDRRLVTEVVDEMMTNETLFFRDDRPFKYFRTNLLPAMIKAREGKKTLRIWSAACSTGQEPYSIAMTLCESIPGLENWRIDILATDISETALAQASSGSFSQFEVQRGLPIQYVMKYFRQEGQSWKVSDKIRSMVKFENFNLMDRMERFGAFDIIFCRNVLIYFDEETKKKVLQSLARRLVPDSSLFLGGSETIIGLCPALKINTGCPGLYALQDIIAQAPHPSLIKGAGAGARLAT